MITAILTHLDGLEDSNCLANFMAIPGAQVVKAGVTTVAKKMETLATPPGEYVSAHGFLEPLSAQQTNHKLMNSFIGIRRATSF